MQLTRFWAAAQERFGVVEDETYYDLSRDIGDLTELAFRSMTRAAGGWRSWAPDAPSFKREEVTRLIPLVGNSYRVFCAARNYLQHAKEGGFAVSAEPLLFFKLPDSMINPDAPIESPAVTQLLDYEGELAVVIGWSGRNIPESQALDHVLGYTVMNEMSARDLQSRHEGGQRVTDWFSGKALDHFAPLGPHIVTSDEVGDPSQLQLKTRLNGEVVQDVTVSELIFNIPRLISYISERATLHAFDVIATGTPAGVGHARGRRLEVGDLVEVEVSRVGTLSNRVIQPLGSATTPELAPAGAR